MTNDITMSTGPTEDAEPAGSHIITDNDAIRAYVHPTRIGILEILTLGKKTVSQVARILGVHSANITHHFRLLERTGLIRLVEKRDTGRNLEKYYRAIARTFIVGPANESMQNKQSLVLSILMDDLSRAARFGTGEEKTVFGLLTGSRIKDEDMPRFIQGLKELTDAFKTADAENGNPYTINVSIYPSDTSHIPQKEIIIE